MTAVARQGDQVVGTVGHHAGHVIGQDSEGLPIYCSGHAVVGSPVPASAKLRVLGSPVILSGDRGASNCACDYGAVVMQATAHRLRVGGRSAVADHDPGDFHGQGTGLLMAATAKLRLTR